jgi:hypothetical protein
MPTPRLFAFISLCIGIACGGTTEPRGTPATVPPGTDTTTILATPPFAVPARAAKIYRGSDALYASSMQFHRGVLASRYVLFEDSTFVLQFSSPRFGLIEYGGRFTRTTAGITFDFSVPNTIAPWQATATFEQEALRIHYNLAMSITDFVDGAYVRER